MLVNIYCRRMIMIDDILSERVKSLLVGKKCLVDRPFPKQGEMGWSWQNKMGEEVPSSEGYVSGYKENTPENPNALSLAENLDDLERELEIIRKHLPRLAKDDLNRQYLDRIRNGELSLPDGAGRWVLIPNWHKTEKRYGKACLRMLDILDNITSISRVNKHWEGGLFNVREYCKRGLFGTNEYCEAKRLKQKKEKSYIMQYIHREQRSNIAIVPVQFGIRHRGRSLWRVDNIKSSTEFHLGMYEVVFLLMAHPERLQREDDLSVCCAGDWHYFMKREYVPGFCFDDRPMPFEDNQACYDAYENAGFATGFLTSESSLLLQ